MQISIVRDAVFFFVYEDLLIVLYRLGYKLYFFSLLDNELPVYNTNFVFVPGGYPERFVDRLCKLYKFLIFLKKQVNKHDCKVYAECGGFIILSKKFIIDSHCYNCCRTFNVVNKFKAIVLKMYKVCCLNDFNFLFNAHEFHYCRIISQRCTNLFLAKSAVGISLHGVLVKEALGSYLHITR